MMMQRLFHIGKSSLRYSKILLRVANAILRRAESLSLGDLALSLIVIAASRFDLAMSAGEFSAGQFGLLLVGFAALKNNNFIPFGVRLES
jgi:hypothetical protein